MPTPRYAIYFVPAPDSLIYRIGASLLGYDVYGGKRLPFPEDLPFAQDDWLALTDEPRAYGFHATLKAPFRLAAGRSAEELAAQLTTFAAAQEPVVITPAVRTMGGFAALIPEERSPALDRLAGDCVEAFDSFRAPLNENEWRKRLASPLTEQHKKNLERWGYPFVFEEFRFHMTLTGRVAPDLQDDVLGFLRGKLGAVEGRPLPVDRVALLCQPDHGTSFHLIASAPLSTR